MTELDAIMVDKGFQIDVTNIMYHSMYHSMYQTSISKRKKQFSMSEALQSRDIASAQVHIEQINQRIKTFKIFQTKFPCAHVNLANDIMYIIMWSL